jgi:hypothetical protein
MVIVLFWLLACTKWQADAKRLLLDWPEQTGRVCSACGQRALVGHGRRKRTVHCGQKLGRRWPVCLVLVFQVQRVRCTRCGKTHTLLPAFLAPYQRHPNTVRQTVLALREAGQSWREVLRVLRQQHVPLGTARSPQRWIRRLKARLGAATAALARRLPPPGSPPHYGSVERPGSWAAFAELVRTVARSEGSACAAGEELAAANRLARGQWAL